MILHASDPVMRVLAACLLVFAVAACGTKGSLHLPPPEPADDTTTKQKR